MPVCIPHPSSSCLRQALQHHAVKTETAETENVKAPTANIVFQDVDYGWMETSPPISFAFVLFCWLVLGILRLFTFQHWCAMGRAFLRRWSLNWYFVYLQQLKFNARILECDFVIHSLTVLWYWDIDWQLRWSFSGWIPGFLKSPERWPICRWPRTRRHRKAPWQKRMQRRPRWRRRQWDLEEGLWYVIISYTCIHLMYICMYKYIYIVHVYIYILTIYIVSILDNRCGYFWMASRFSFVAFSCLCFLALKATNHSPNWLREQEVGKATTETHLFHYSTLQIKPVKLWSLWRMTGNPFKGGESAHDLYLPCCSFACDSDVLFPRHWGALQKWRRNRNTSSTARRTCCHAVKNDRCILASCNSAPSWGSESLKEMGRQLKGALPFEKHLYHEINLHITDT